MGLASERLIVPISVEDKRMVTAKAARLGRMSTAELVRRAVAAYDPQEPEAEAALKTLLAAFPAIHAQTIAQLDKTDAALDRCLSHYHDRTAA